MAMETIPPLNIVTPGIPLREDDHLRVSLMNGGSTGTLTIRTRIITHDGRIVESVHALQQTQTFVVMVGLFDLTPGHLLSVTVRDFELPQPRKTYVTFGIQKGGKASDFPHTVLGSGFLAETNFYGWPGGKVETALDGPGFTDIHIPNDGTAGANATVTTIASSRSEIIAVNFTFTTSATSGTRRVHLQFDESSDVKISSDITQSNSETKEYHFTQFGADGFEETDDIMVPMARGIIVNSEEEWRIAAQNIKTGDQFTDILVHYQTWWDNI
jgi:hypothetical protein